MLKTFTNTGSGFIIFWIIIYFSFVSESRAQYENVWVFGRYAGLDFSSGSPEPIRTSIDGNGNSNVDGRENREANASVCDENGNLLFYTEGSYVWDKYGNIMTNGAGIIPIPRFIPEWTQTTSACQGTIIVPVPGSDHKFYIFSLTSAEYGNGPDPENYAVRLYYSLVDMKQNDGLGMVVPEERGVLLDSFLTERMTSVAGNNCNVWLIVYSREIREFKSYEINERGINKTPVISTGNRALKAMLDPIYSSRFRVHSIGEMEVSPKRNKLAVADASIFGGKDLYFSDFDPLTGVVSNLTLIDSNSMEYYGVAFSGDGSKLYARDFRHGGIYQFDLSVVNSSDILSTKYWVNQDDIITSANNPKRAENGKIYSIGSINNGGSTQYVVNVINEPNNKGVLCGYQTDVARLLPRTRPHWGRTNTVSKAIVLDTIFDYKEVYVCFNQNELRLSLDTTSVKIYWDDGSTELERRVDRSGEYWVRYYNSENPCVALIDTYSVTFLSDFLYVLTSPSCFNDSNGTARLDILLEEGPEFNFVWESKYGDTLSLNSYLSGVPSGEYILRISNDSCIATIKVWIPEVTDKVSFTLSDSLICVGETISLENTSSDHYFDFIWLINDQDTILGGYGEYKIKEAGQHKIVLIGKGGICKDSFEKYIWADSAVSDFSVLIDKKDICVGKSININTILDSTMTNILWEYGDGVNEYSLSKFKRHAYDISGIMHLRLTAIFRACPPINYVDSVWVYPLPRVDLGPDSVICLHGSPVTLRNYYAYEEGDDYRWSTGSQQSSISVVHHGSYTLTVTNRYGCMNQESVRVDKDCYIDIPNAFTPNGDGLNDYFFPRQLLSEGVVSFEFKIFNRWGQLIFSTTSVEGRGWDGRFNGVDQPLGVYVYVLELLFDNERTEQYKGNVTLIR